MRHTLLGAAALVITGIVLSAQGDGRPTCRNCPSTYVPKDELQAYINRAIAGTIVDQQVRAVDVGRMNVGVGRDLSRPAREPGTEFRRRTSSGQRGLPHHRRRGDDRNRSESSSARSHGRPTATACGS